MKICNQCDNARKWWNPCQILSRFCPTLILLPYFEKFTKILFKYLNLNQNLEGTAVA